MRDLTLHEKITLKGIFSKFAIHPRLTMEDALFISPRYFGKSVGQLAQLRKYKPV